MQIKKFILMKLNWIYRWFEVNNFKEINDLFKKMKGKSVINIMRKFWIKSRKLQLMNKIYLFLQQWMKK